MRKIASYSYEHNDGDQIWEDITTFYEKEDGTYLMNYRDGYYGDEHISEITYDEIINKMTKAQDAVAKKREMIAIYGHSPRTRGGYEIYMDLIPRTLEEEREDADVERE